MTVSSTTSSIIYVGDGLTTEFDVPFRFLEDSDLQLSIQATDGTVTNLVLNSDYTVSGANEDNGGKVYLVNPVGDQAKLSILRIMDMLQEVDYRENERFPAESHERALDKLTFEVQQLQEQSDRAIKVDVFSDVEPDVLIGHVERVWESCDNIDTVADDITNVDTVSSNISDVNTTATNIADVSNVSNSIGNVNTVANSISNVNAVGTNIADVTTVAGDLTSIDTVAGISTQVVTVAGIAEDIDELEDIAQEISTVTGIANDVTTVAGISTDVSTVAGIASDVSAVENISADVSTVAAIDSAVSAVAAIDSAVSAVAGDKTNIDTVASDIASVRVTSNYISDVTTVAFDITNVNTVAGISSDVTTVSGISAYVSAVAGNSINVNTVATNIADVNTAATNIADIQAAPTAASNAAASATLAQDWATKMDGQVASTDYSSKYYANQSSLSAQQAAISAAGTHFKLFQHQWFDYELNNDMAWLRADTFSWQDGTVYTNAYNHLVDDIDGVTSTTETINGSTVTFYRAADGHKIVLADQETTVENIYTSTGVAWYYVLDTVNSRFKLPRTKYGFDGLSGNVGDYISESLPNITGKILSRPVPNSTAGAIRGASGAFTYSSKTSSTASTSVTVDSTITTTDETNFDASRSSSTYQNSAPVQQRGTQQYLYFYVGQFSQSAIEQTAGLNAELFNNKIDINGSNILEEGANKILSTSSYTTNRILEIPQDVKLEINSSNKLVLKAGSKVYIPNGFEADGTTPKFDVVTIESDIVNSNSHNGYHENFLLNRDSTNIVTLPDENQFSGPTQPTGYGTYAIWYDTANNIIKNTGDGGSTWISGLSLPVCRALCGASNTVTSIDQIFNGFGYIASTAFVLPGVKVALPCGLNENGTNIFQIRTIDSVEISNNIHYNVSGVWSGTIVITPTYAGRSYKYIPVSKRSSIPVVSNGYVVEENITLQTDVSGNITTTDLVYGNKMCCLVDFTCKNGVVTEWKPHFVDSVANSNMSNISNAGRSFLSGLGAVSSNSVVTSLALGASSTVYTAPSTGYVRLRATGGNYLGITILGIGAYQSVASNTTLHFWSVLLKKGTQYSIEYNGTLTNHTFISADGEN